MFGKSKKYDAFCLMCDVGMELLIALLVLVTIASLTGMYMAHVTSYGLVFGTMSGSLSIIAVSFNLFLVKKFVKMCGCGCSCSVPAAPMKLTSKIGGKKK